MKDILDTIAKHYKSHVVEAKPIGEDEAEIIIRMTVHGVDPNKLDNVVRILDIFVQGLGKGKIIIPVTKKTRKQLESVEEKMKKLQDRRLKAYLIARNIHVEGMENE